MWHHKQLAQHGSLMIIPDSKLTGNTSDNAAYIQAGLEDRVGCPIHEAFTGECQVMPQQQPLLSASSLSALNGRDITHSLQNTQQTSGCTFAVALIFANLA